MRFIPLLTPSRKPAGSRLVLLACGFTALVGQAPAAEPLELQLRHRVETAEGSERFHTLTRSEAWELSQTALIICDVWDLHTSRNATLRTGELAPRIDRLAKSLRDQGVTVIHCPSDTMTFYEGHPSRKAAIAVPKAADLPPEIGKWCYSIPSEERGIYPLDQSDGGQDDDPESQRQWAEELTARGRKTQGPWIKQHEAIHIAPGDFVTDKGDEVWSILESRGIDNVLMTGVHTNMCVLGRPFGLRRLASNGKNVALVRDLTDTMYNPAKRPYVSHFTGTDLIIEHIEKYVCPTVTSDQVLGGESFVFKEDDRPHVVIAMSEPEYETEKTLPAFAKRHLGRDFRVSLVFGDEKERNDLPGLEVLRDADVLLISLRRRALSPDQMKLIRDFIEAGKPVVGIRTASHALSLRGKEPPEGRVTWESFDADVFGGNYSNHYGNGPEAQISIAEGAKEHSILTSVDTNGMTSRGSLYVVSPLKDSATPLLMGAIEGRPPEPVAWTNETRFGGKAFYTSLGHKGDFEKEPFRRLLSNSLLWAVGREIPETMPDAEQDAARDVGDQKQSRLDELTPLSPRDELTPLSLGRGAGGEGIGLTLFASSHPSIRAEEQLQAQPNRHPSSPLPRERGTGMHTIPDERTTGVDAACPPAEFVSFLSQNGDESNSSFTVPDDLEWDLVLSEPEIAQPVFMDFDERGRLWVAQYLQYPNPAGLKMLSKDKFWRAVYDKIPEPPPHHVRGADKITIHEDTDGDGTFDSHKTFIEGLSIVTSFARGRGGVFVLNPPYLLFYPDLNNDDVPDSDPQVLLAGFGLEDTHSCANSLRFGPDGWLYACQGSTVSGHVVRPGTDDKPIATMGQLIWRYHPEKRIYEVFAEGGGNAFGLEIDSTGNIYSGHNGGDTRGFHYIQGGYYRKGFEKHGPLSNPHTYGFYEPMKHPPVPRFTHHFVIYEGHTLPAEYRGRLFGVEPLQGQVTLTEIRPNGSTFETRDLDRSIRSAEGSRFRPVHITTGPDGAIYVADFHEEYIAHRDHFEGRIAKETGRIYRMKSMDGGNAVKVDSTSDLSKRSSAELVALFDHPNRWHREAALRLLADRRDRSVLPRLRQELLHSKDGGTSPLGRLWALHQLGGLDEPTTLAALDHSNPNVRSWAVRLTCDDAQVEPAIADKLVSLASAEPDVRVRVQLACSARRLPADFCLAIVGGLLHHHEDREDAFLPLSVWWAVEAKCETDPEAVMAFVENDDVWSHALARDVLAERIMRRFASGNRTDLARCATLLKSTRDADVRKRFLAGFEAAFRGRSAVALPDSLTEALAEIGEVPLSLRVRQGDPEAVTEAIGRLNDDSVSTAERADLVSLLGETRPNEALPIFLSLFDSAADAKLQTASIGALAGYRDATIADRFIDALRERATNQQIAILSVLVSRSDWASKLVEAVSSNRIDRSLVPADVSRRLLLHDDVALSRKVVALWPELETTEQRSQGDLASLQETVVAGTADPYRGKRLFLDACGRCHRLFGEGGDVGPDLTSDPRNDLSRLLGAVAVPSAEIREGFETYVAVTADGRVISGLLIDQDDHVVVLREADGRAVTLRRDELDELVRQAKSLMPDGMLDRMSDQEVRDLFAYLRSSQPLND